MGAGMMDKYDILRAYETHESVRKTARVLGLSYQTVRRVLMDAGVGCSEQGARIRSMMADGQTAAQIASGTGMRASTVQGYMPYTRGPYAVGEKTYNAQYIAAWRARRRANGKQG